MPKNQKGFGVIAVVAGLAVILSVPFLVLVNHYQAALRIQQIDDLRDEVNKLAHITSRSLIVENVCNNNLNLNGLMNTVPATQRDRRLNLHYGNGAGGLAQSIFDSTAATWNGTHKQIWAQIVEVQPRSATSALLEIAVIAEVGEDRRTAKADTLFLVGLNAAGQMINCTSTHKNSKGIIMEDTICRTRRGPNYVYSPAIRDCEIGTLVLATSLGDF